MPSLSVIDLAIVGGYLVAMLGIGIYFMRRQKSAAEFLLASRDVGWFAIGLSLLSSLNSALDYIVGPASYIEWGAILFAGIIAVALAFPVVFKLFIPFYQRLKIFNCYEYLEKRFDVRVRTTASGIFIIWRICWMAFTAYLPAYALNVVMGLPLFPTIVTLGVFTTLYTTLGGTRAVVWTDVAQAFIMLGGLLVTTLLAVHGVPGGIAGVWKAADQEHLLRMTASIPGWDDASIWEKISLYFHFPVTLLSVLILCFISQLNNYGADQVMIQRYLSARSLKDCQVGFVINALAYLIYVILFFILSMSLMAFFRQNPIPSELVPKNGKFEFYFPYFIGSQLPPVFKGFILIAIYAAAQSTTSAGISACTSVIYVNFYERLVRGQLRVPEHRDQSVERQVMIFNRVCTVSLGVVVTCVACIIPHIGESLFQLANTVVCNFAGVMIPVFLLGMFSRRARSLGVAIGAVLGVVSMFIWGFGHRWGLFSAELGYGWTITVGFLTTVIVCYVISAFERAPAPEKLNYLWKNVMSREHHYLDSDREIVGVAVE